MLPDAFGCVVANRFGNLLDDDDDDPLDFISKVELEREKVKKKKKDEDDKKNKQKKNVQKESQRNRRLPAGVDGQDPASGTQKRLGCVTATHPKYKLLCAAGKCRHF